MEIRVLRISEGHKIWGPEGQKCIVAIEQILYESKAPSSVKQTWQLYKVLQSYNPDTEKAKTVKYGSSVMYAMYSSYYLWSVHQ